MNHNVDFLRAIIALVFVLGLIWSLGVVIRKYGWKLGLPTTPLRPARTRRLQLVEVMPLDGKNKLVIVRHDDKEHLLLVGTEASTVVETRTATLNKEQ